jgi:lantibiotic modifying enzyme
VGSFELLTNFVDQMMKDVDYNILRYQFQMLFQEVVNEVVEELMALVSSKRFNDPIPIFKR